MPEPTTLDDAVQQEFLRPFPPQILQRLKPDDDWLIGPSHLFTRLTRAVGGGGWHLTYKDWHHGPNFVSVTATLTILGMTREARGLWEGNQSEKLACWDAFQDACQTFGLGLYLNFLPLDKDPRTLPVEVHAEAAKQLGWRGGVKAQDAPAARREASEGAVTWVEAGPPPNLSEGLPAAAGQFPENGPEGRDGLLPKAKGLLSLCVDKGLVAPEKQASCLKWLPEARPEEIGDLIQQMQARLDAE